MSGQQQLRDLRPSWKLHAGPLNVNNAPAHRGEAVREYLRMGPAGEPRSPDFNADEAISGRERRPGNRRLVQERVGNFMAGLVSRVKRGEAPLPDGPTVKGRSTPAKFSGRFPASGECTSHLGLGLVWRFSLHPYRFRWIRLDSAGFGWKLAQPVIRAKVSNIWGPCRANHTVATL